MVDALTVAVGRSDLQPGCIVHSDRGAKYPADELRREVRRLGLRQSVGRTGSCYDNAAAESFFALLKAEIGTHRWPDRATALSRTVEAAPIPDIGWVDIDIDIDTDDPALIPPGPYARR
ncbi:hypothetical protein ABZT06_46585 [Streptomyces sp. NPDC005483]|uniref:hypothetical protein n=1 Tax=Streptomyces sp. NPDC005483 TaxID=3154882 RepID=UPI0033B32798